VIVANLNICVITRLDWANAARCAVELAWDTRVLTSTTSSASPSTQVPDSGTVDLEMVDLAPNIDVEDGSGSEGEGLGTGGPQASSNFVIGEDEEEEEEEEEEEGYTYGAGDTNTLLRQ
jgi:hypothetical protein